MTWGLRIFLIILIAIGMISVYKTIKRKKISMKYGMYFTIVFILLILLIICPNIVENLANIFGFKEAPNMLFLISIFILFYVVFQIYTTITKLSETNKTLVQELSILKKELEKNKRQQ